MPNPNSPFNDQVLSSPRLIDCPPSPGNPLGNPRLSEMDEQMEQLRSTVERLGGRVSVLADRLYAVMRPIEPYPTELPEAMCTTPFGSNLQGRRLDIEAASQVLQDMINRLEI